MAAKVKFTFGNLLRTSPVNKAISTPYDEKITSLVTIDVCPFADPWNDNRLQTERKNAAYAGIFSEQPAVFTPGNPRFNPTKLR